MDGTAKEEIDIVNKFSKINTESVKMKRDKQREVCKLVYFP